MILYEGEPQIGELTFRTRSQGTMKEVAYIMEGEATIIPRDSRDPVTVRAGDVVTIPAGLVAHWKVTRPLRKRYKFLSRKEHNVHQYPGSKHSGLVNPENYIHPLFKVARLPDDVRATMTQKNEDE